MHLAGVVEPQEFEPKLAIDAGLLIMMEFFSFMKNVLQHHHHHQIKTQHYVDMFHQQQHVLHLVEVILLGPLVKFFIAWVEKEQELELVPEQTAQHIPKQTQRLAAPLIVGLGVPGLVELEHSLEAELA
jgi:hypothetical protein